jgi:hypothetical protein
MKPILLTLLIPLLLAILPANAQQAEKTFVKSFNVKNFQVVMLDVEGAVQLKSWNEEQLRIMMTITLQDGTETVLKSLVKAGRYNLDVEENEGELRIIAPGLDKELMFRNGSGVGEQVSFIVYAPQNVFVKTRGGEATGMVEKPKSDF